MDRASFGPASLDRYRAFEAISRELLRTQGEQPTLQRTAELAAATVPGCDACGVSMQRSDGAVDTPAYTSPLIELADATQYELGDAPCLDAVWKFDTCLIEDMATETR